MQAFVWIMTILALRCAIETPETVSGMAGTIVVHPDPASGGLRIVGPAGAVARLHPLWLRERTGDPENFDPVNHQRLFEPPELALDLRVTDAAREGADDLAVAFDDGTAARLSLTALLQEPGWTPDPEAPPAPEIWDAASAPRPEATWAGLDDPAVLRELLAGFHRHGFCVVRETPTAPGSLQAIAQRFGFIRDTNFGPLFDVVTKPKPIDLAYTGRHLSAHADNPYRRPIPGIQLLHCLENGVAGGLSTLVDGFAVARRIAAEAPESFAALTRIPVRFRYESNAAIMQAHGPLIECDAGGLIRRVRFSTRVDYVPARDPDELALYYYGRRRFYELANDPAYQIRQSFEPGMLVMMDNHRVLHGRTAFDHGAGRRHLQGCYIDHDGPDSLYRVLMRDGAAVDAGRERELADA